MIDQMSKAEYCRARVEGRVADAGRGGLLREAMNVDSRGKPPQVIEDFSLIDVRG